MTNREAAEALVRDFEDVRDLLKGIAQTHPKITKRLKHGASRVETLSDDGDRKATIALYHGEVTAFHASEFDEASQMWNRTTLNLGSSSTKDIPVQVMTQETVHQPREGMAVESIDDIPPDVCDRLYGAIALFGTVEIN